MGGSRGWLVSTGKKKKKTFLKKVPATETLKRKKGDRQVRGLFSATWTRVQTPGRVSAWSGEKSNLSHRMEFKKSPRFGNCVFAINGGQEDSIFRDFPGGRMIKNLPANVGDMGLIPGLGKIPHAVGQLSPRAAATEACMVEPMFCNERSHHG